MSDTVDQGMYQYEDLDPQQMADISAGPMIKHVTVNYLGKVSRVMIDGQELILVNPAVIDHLEKQCQVLMDRSNDLMQRCLRMQQQQNVMVNHIQRLERELGNKVSYD